MEKYRVEGAPPTIHYIPDFITEFEEQSLMKQIQNAPKPKWTQLSRRRLQNWGGLPHPKGMIAESLPEWLTKSVDKVAQLELFGGNKPNHVLINEYLPGQGIMAHTDGPLFYPTVTTITCGSHTLLDFFTPRTDDELDVRSDQTENKSCDSAREPVVSLLLEPRSLVIVQDEMYNKMLHSIAERGFDEISSDKKIANLHLCSETYAQKGSCERGTRYSLTIRHVPKTKKLPAWFKV
ncbi:alpha-ketoglutarate-dependent dioxygenase alkB homolog 6 [Neocloeon triangulifer]|uniref:alpha-ketoglutarate-dependent dioxygenase alkB homolog 6 n=1 Tax=Neocloeon triangulifer TaxID=2078957 RepID=UPI00286F040A|nr:alpha-ketoglutarate-dependent dioxygenase alkB homolog 6 [Neocloeon triangulifer]